MLTTETVRPAPAQTSNTAAGNTVLPKHAKRKAKPTAAGNTVLPKHTKRKGKPTAAGNTVLLKHAKSSNEASTYRYNRENKKETGIGWSMGTKEKYT